MPGFCQGMHRVVQGKLGSARADHAIWPISILIGYKRYMSRAHSLYHVTHGAVGWAGDGRQVPSLSLTRCTLDSLSPGVLTHNPANPRCHPAPRYLAELSIPHELVTVDMRRGDHKKPEFLAINPFGKVGVCLGPKRQGGGSGRWAGRIGADRPGPWHPGVSPVGNNTHPRTPLPSRAGNAFMRAEAHQCSCGP